MSVSALFACNEPEANTIKEPEWRLLEKITYQNVLTKEGYLDTVYITQQIYKDDELKDSTKMFKVLGYNSEGKPSRINYFKEGRNGIELVNTVVNEYDAKGNKIAGYEKAKGIESKVEKYVYNDSSRPVSYYVKAKADNDVFEMQDSEISSLQKSNGEYNVYNVSYEYDEQSRVSKTIVADESGKPVRTDLNLYTGNVPLATYSLDTKGDTLQKVQFTEDGDVLKIVSQRDSLIVTKWMYKGALMLGKTTENINTKKAWKRVLKYNNEGQLIEQALYELL